LLRTGGTLTHAPHSIAESPTTPGIPPDVVCLTDFQEAARAVLSRMAYDYVAGAAADELSLGWNTESFRRIRLRPRVLVDLPTIDTRISLLGAECSCPVLLAPTAYHRLMHPDGELATARGAAAAGVPYVVSTATTTSLDAIARAADGVRWFQLYVLGDRDRTRQLVVTAEAAGCQAICLTVDTPVAGARNREQRARVRLPDGVHAAYFHHVVDATNMRTSFTPPTWRDVEWLKSATTLPVLLKGILTGDDADRAVTAGVAGIVVSNHGARNLDTVPATIDALPEVAAAVASRVPVLLDGGVRRGTDVLKAIALGATAVMIGRPYLFALAVAGAAGVTEVVRMLQSELQSALALTGRPSLAAVDATVLWEGREGRS
jgi:4-hydroxymandelate oxidase